MPKRKFRRKSYRREEKDTSSSEDDSRVSTTLKRPRQDEKRVPTASSHNGTSVLKTLNGEDDDFPWTSTPRNTNQESLDDRSNDSYRGSTPSPMKQELEGDQYSDLEPAFQENGDRGEDSEDNNLEKSTRGGYESFLSFQKSFHFFSEKEESASKDEDESPREEVKSVDEDNSRESVEFEMDVAEYNEYQTTADTAQGRSNYVKSLGFHVKNIEVLFLRHKVSVPLVGYLKVTLLAGKASILGYELSYKQSVNVFSQKQTGLLSVDTLPCDRINSFQFHKIRKDIRSLLNTKRKQEIRMIVQENCTECSVIVALEEQLLPPPLQFVGYYFPEAVSLRKIDRKSENFYTSFLQNTKYVIDIGPEHEELYAKIERHLHKKNKKKPVGYRKVAPSESETTASEGEDGSPATKGARRAKMLQSRVAELQSANESETQDPKPHTATSSCILITGHKKTGKSTMLRYLINKFLNTYEEVFFLDADPGQTEFTPPGVVSLTRVTEPVFGPPYSHQRQPLKMVFIGSITAETSPPMYMRSVVYLMEYFCKNFPSSILLINTMGWISGLGDLILKVIKKAAMPAVEIELQAEYTPLTFEKTQNGVLKCKAGFHRDATTSNKKGDFSPQSLRDYALLAHFGKCQAYYMQPKSFNEIQPYSVEWDNVAIYHFDKRTPHNRFYEALLCSIVALCRVDKCYMMVTDTKNADYPNTLEDEPHNECLGYGLVRSIDETNHSLYVITPLSLESLIKVNAILCGNVLLPNVVLLNQPILEKELSFTDQSIEGPTESRQKVQRRGRYNISNLQ